MGSSLWAARGPGEGIATINIAINYVQTATEGDVVCRVTLDRRNRTTAVLRAEVVHDDGRLVATARLPSRSATSMRSTQSSTVRRSCRICGEGTAESAALGANSTRIQQGRRAAGGRLSTDVRGGGRYSVVPTPNATGGHARARPSVQSFSRSKRASAGPSRRNRG